jgi:tRNA dimethylallyltransferase
MSVAQTAPLIVVAGPTGSGKSDLALHLAQMFDGEIVNCDSLQIYRHLDIGTAKVPLSARGGIPHHLIDIADPNEVFTAGDFARRARPILRSITERARLPIVAGGTGFYIRALLEGLFSGPGRDDGLRKRLTAREARHPGSLHRLLCRFDSEAGKRIHSGDVQKTIRALEVYLLSRRPLTSWFAESREALEGYRVLKLALNPPRDLLYERLEQRARRMFERGLIEEVQGVISLGFPATSKAFEALGYRQALAVVLGKMGIDEAISDTQRTTRQYAKRQWTWFRRESGVVWIEGFGTEAESQERATALVQEFLDPPNHS